MKNKTQFDYAPCLSDHIEDGIKKRYDFVDLFFNALIAFIIGFVLANIYMLAVYDDPHIKCIPEIRYIYKDAPTPEPEASPSGELEASPSAMLKGTASYYSEAGCLGCSPTLTMANGERLDDTKLTIAVTVEDMHRYKLLNDVVIVRNVRNGRTVEAKITDTGGFHRYNRIADLSVATRNAIKCSDLCNVEILTSM